MSIVQIYYCNISFEKLLELCNIFLNYVTIKNNAFSCILGPIFTQKRIISNKLAMSLSSSHQQSISFKISEVSNKSILRKLHKYGKQGNFGYFRSNFWANKNFLERQLTYYVSLK